MPDVTDESAIRGLMILGRTREEAVWELFEAQCRRDRQMESEFWEDATRDKIERMTR